MKSEDCTSNGLNYHHLRYFHMVATEGSLSGAAKKLNVSQPSMCSQIKQLEATFGAPLFRRSGRSLVLTEFGCLVHTYTTDIFSLGQELLTATNRGASSRMLRLQVGIVDSFPKLLSLDILRPLFSHEPPVMLSCLEGKIEDLLNDLATLRLDVVVSDAPAPTPGNVKTYTHALGSSGITFFAAPSLAQRLTGRFPSNLHGAPALLPMQNTPQRRELDAWFRRVDVEPRFVGEFADAALANVVATEGFGFIAVPSMVAEDAVERYGYEILGRTEDCRAELFLITVDRRIEHPALITLASQAVKAFAQRSSTRDKKTPRKKGITP